MREEEGEWKTEEPRMADDLEHHKDGGGIFF